MSRCEEARILLGVYVLGAIDPAERSQVDAHLGGCPACRDELAGMAGLPALLGRVNEAQLTQVAGPPAELLDSLLARAARERRRPRRLFGGWPLLAAAAAALVVAGAVIGGLAASPERETRVVAGPTVTVTPAPEPEPSEREEPPGEEFSAGDPATGLSARIVVRKVNWGTEAELHLKGVKPGMKCRLEAVARDGSRDSMGSWTVPRTGYQEFWGSTMLPRDRVVAFEVVTPMGENMLTIRL